MSISVKNLIRITSIAGFCSLTNIIVSNPAQAFSVTFYNGDFEDFSYWTEAQNANIEEIYSDVPPYGDHQAVITNACPSAIQLGSICYDEDGNGLPRNDDYPTIAGIFNSSDRDQVSASIEQPNNLQSILGLSNNALAIYRTIDGVTYDGTNGNPVLRRTPKEGSAIYQDITVSEGGNPNDFVLKFDWDFLTNDGAGDLGDKDYGFVSITNSSGFERLFVLESSTGSIPTLSSGDINFAKNTNPYAAYTSDPLALTPGTYRVGFGVIDVDGVGYSSALLVDNIEMQQVPFEFSPTLGLLIVGGLFGCDRLLRRYKSNHPFEIHK